MVRHAGIPQLAGKTFPGHVIFLACVLAVAGLVGCGGSGGPGTVPPTPTPTPTPVPTPTPAPTPLPAGAIEFKVLDSTVPPGGIYQYQLSTTEPKPIGHGSTRPSVPPALTTRQLVVARGTAINDPNGVAAGIAVINGSNIAVQMVGANVGSTLGTNIFYPLLTISMQVPSTATPGQTFNASFDVANSQFFDASQTLYTLVPPAAPGVLTIGAAGTPYVSDVVPGGGLLPDRSVVKIFGANFTPSTRIAIEDTTIFGPPTTDTTFVSSSEIDVVLCNGIVPATATSCPNTGATLQLDGERVRVRDSSFNPTTQIDYYTYRRADDVPGASSNTLVTQVHPMYSRQTYLSATIPLVQSATKFTGLSLQNTAGVDDGIKIELLDTNGASLTPTPATFSFILPGLTGTATAGKRITRDVIADWFGGTVPAGAVKVRMTVTSGNAPVQMLGMLGDTSVAGSPVVTPVIPQ
jgi:hypothetical protein